MNTYLITDPSIYTHDLKSFTLLLEKNLKKYQPDFALYRDKAFENYDVFAEVFVYMCRKYQIKSMLHNKAPLAQKLKAYGVHYSSDKLCSIGITSKELFQVLSTHSLDEILSAKTLGIDAVTFSPIFSSPNKGEPKGIAILEEIVQKSELPIIALGGIVEDKEIKAVEKTGVWGFASIRYFN